MNNPVLARIESLWADGLPVGAVRIERRGPMHWMCSLSIPLYMPHGEGDGSCGAGYSVRIDPPPPGVALQGWERHPDDVIELAGSVEQIEAVVADVAREGRASDWARFDHPEYPGYPHFLTKPNRWLHQPLKASSAGR